MGANNLTSSCIKLPDQIKATVSFLHWRNIIQIFMKIRKFKNLPQIFVAILIKIPEIFLLQSWIIKEANNVNYFNRLIFHQLLFEITTLKVVKPWKINVLVKPVFFQILEGKMKGIPKLWDARFFISIN